MPPQNPNVRKVVANINNLGMHLQRHNPNEWNELVQVVLQGVVFASRHVECTCHASPTVQEKPTAAPAPRVGRMRVAQAAELKRREAEKLGRGKAKAGAKSRSLSRPAVSRRPHS